MQINSKRNFEDMIQLTDNNYFLIMLIAFPITILFLVWNNIRAGGGKVKPLKNIYNVDETTTLKGICAIIIMLHHFSNKILYNQFSFIYSFYVKAGYLAVAVFLFISGYCLMYQFNKKGTDYLKHFLPKRLIRLYIPFFVCTIFVDIIRRKTFVEWLWDVLTFNSIIEIDGTYNATWFMLAIIYFSLSFFIVCKLASGLKKIIVGSWLSGATWIILCSFIGVGSWWYNTAFTFALGMTICAFREKIYDYVKSYIYTIMLLTTTIFILGYAITVIFTSYVIVQTINGIAIALLSWMICYIFTLKSNFYKWVGKFSLELFLIHSAILETFYSLNIKKDGWTILPVVGMCILMGYVLHMLSSKIIQLVEKGVQYEKKSSN